MKHLGDITKLKGSEVPLTEIVVGGSPCQDLSVAGKRAGLAGARSGLFMEQIRLIKEMRENDRKNGRTDEHIRPRYMVWENVPGAFSSNKGEDFRAVLEETAKVAEGDACIPRLEKWPHAGCIMGDGWSLAWRVHDAQFWGVPQRRKRIALVADFGGETAPEILFERKGLSGNITESGEERKGTTEDAEGCSGETIGFTNRGFESGDVTETLRSEPHGAYPMVMEEPYNATTGSFMRAGNSGIAETLAARDYKDPQIVCQSIVRRLTPLECERLQGFPDGWTDIGEWVDSKGKKHKGESDSPRYKALGNSIALPFWQWMAHKMVKYIDGHQPTMASLFSGIGGFELVFSKAGCEPVWCSEIEEFPIAVTKYHFPDNE